ncbi:MAG: hypothetical protein ABI650_06745 [Dokdonella sp.]
MRRAAGPEIRMGLLDELDSEAQKRRAEDEDGEARKQQREVAYRTLVEPGMQRLHAYLGELVSRLKQLQQKVLLRHSVPGYGDLVSYVDHEYELRGERQPSSREIILSFAATIASSECPNVQVDGSNRVRALSALFQRHRLGAALAPQKDATGDVVAATFKAKGRIPLVMRAFADTTTGQLRLEFSNFDELGSAVKMIAPERIGEALFDEIGRYLMREPTELMREALPEDYRNALRARVHQQEVRRRWEMQIAARQTDEIAQLKREHGIGARFNRLGDAVGRLRDFVVRKS